MRPALFCAALLLAAQARSESSSLPAEAAAVDRVMAAPTTDWSAFDLHANAFQGLYEKAGPERASFDEAKRKIEAFAKRRPGGQGGEQAARARLAAQLKLPIEALPADAGELTSALHKLYTNGRLNQADYQAAVSAMGALPAGHERSWRSVLTAVESPRERAFKGTTSFGAAEPPSPVASGGAAGSPPYGTDPRTGITVANGVDPYFELKYKPGFQHLDHVEPDAPKGGRLARATTSKFDTYSPFDWAKAFKQRTAPELRRFVFQTLMTTTGENGTSLYGLVAEKVEYPKDATWAVFHINPKAHYSNGVPVTAEDVKFSYETQRATDRYFDMMVLKPVVGVEVLDLRRIKFLIKPETQRQGMETVAALGGIYVLNKDFYTKHPMDKMNMDVLPLGSGPYVVEKGEAAKFIQYKRDPNYWAKDLPIHKGQFNFDEVRFDYYADATTARMAFLRGDANLMWEGDMKQWAELEKKAKQGQLQTIEVPYVMPPGFSGLAFNTNSPYFKDRRVRRALSLAMHFEWINKYLFSGSDKRSTSLFDGTPFAHTREVSDAERKLLAPFRGQLAPEVFDADPNPRAAPASDAFNRENTKAAMALLKEAGWNVDPKTFDLRDASGRPFSFEVFYSQPSMEKWLLAYAGGVKRLGIEMKLRRMDTSSWVSLIDQGQYDMAPLWIKSDDAPREGPLADTLSSAGADQQKKNRNYARIRSPVVDALIERIKTSQDKEEWIAAARSLDRVVMSECYFIPMGTDSTDRVAFNQPYGHEKTPATYYGLDADRTWFVKK